MKFGNCLVGETLISVIDQESGFLTVCQIEKKVINGEAVVVKTYTPQDNSITFTKVLEVQQTRARDEVYQVIVKSYSTIRSLKCTGDQPVYVVHNQYKAANKLSHNDELLLIDEGFNMYHASFFDRLFVGYDKVYDMILEKNNNVFANNILVYTGGKK